LGPDECRHIVDVWPRATVLRAETPGRAAALLAFGAGGWGFTLDAQASQ